MFVSICAFSSSTFAVTIHFNFNVSWLNVVPSYPGIDTGTALFKLNSTLLSTAEYVTSYTFPVDDVTSSLLCNIKPVNGSWSTIDFA